MNDLEEPCIRHQGYFSAKGYGIIYRNGKVMKVHRLIMGNPEGKVVMHLCDNPACVNPKHLRVGTSAENTQDMVNKGRANRGSDRPAAKLTEQDIPEIMKYKGKLSSRKTGALFGVSYNVIQGIWNKTAWRHVSGN